MSVFSDLNMTFTGGGHVKRVKCGDKSIKSGKLEMPFGVHRICCVNLDIPI